MHKYNSSKSQKENLFPRTLTAQISQLSSIRPHATYRLHFPLGRPCWGHRSSEGRDSWQRAQAGVSLAPPGCLRGPGAASPVTGPQLQVEQSRGEEKVEWGKAACSLRRRQTGVSARPHAAPRPAMGPLWLQLAVCPKPGLTARSVLRRVRQRLHPVKSSVRITIRSAGPGSHARPDGQQVPPRPLASATGTKRMEQQLPEPRRQAAEHHHNQPAAGRACL